MATKIMRIAGAVVWSLLMFSGSYAQPVASNGNRGIESREYLISNDDVLEITVYGETELSATLRVSQDGTINYPFLGNIRAVGLTLRELESNITELLAQDYLVNPQVRVFVSEYATKISILGAVHTPGSYQLKERLTFTQAIALAGGFSDTANSAEVKIIRERNHSKVTIMVDADRIMGKAEDDVEIKGNDMIVVDEYGRYSMMGQVNKPGVYNLKKGLRVTEAIVYAGGFTATAAQNGTKLIRIDNGQKRVMVVPVADIMRGGDASRDVLVQEGDTIVIPESFF